MTERGAQDNGTESAQEEMIARRDPGGGGGGAGQEERYTVGPATSHNSPVHYMCVLQRSDVSRVAVVSVSE